MLDHLTDPDSLLADMWNRLAAGRDNSTHAFHTAVVGNVDEIEGVSLRTVVLRKLDTTERTIVFHTDRRSAKFAQLLHDPTVAWLFYDPINRLQLRFRTSATLHTNDAVAQELWVGTPALVRAMYSRTAPPGSPLPAHDAPLATSGDGREHFAVVRCRIEAADWLHLNPLRHRRAQLIWPDGELRFQWIAP